MNGILEELQPLEEAFGIDFKCDNCGHSTKEHFRLQDSIWKCKECGEKRNNEKNGLNDIIYNFFK